MTAKKRDTVPDWADPDEIPDLSTDEWAKVIEVAPVRRGRPKADVTKVSTTIRLDPDVIEAFKAQIRLAKELDLPIVVHCRESFDEIFAVLEEEKHERLRGIFHCFTGTIEQIPPIFSAINPFTVP